MKLFGFDIASLSTLHHQAPWITWPDSVMQRSGKPIFLPVSLSENAELPPFRWLPAFAVRIGKLGKSITHKFAFRYCESVAPTVILFQDGVLADLSHGRYPAPSAYCYDGAVTAGEFLPLSSDTSVSALPKLRFSSRIALPDYDDADVDTSWMQQTHIPDLLAHAVVAAAAHNTLKIGDMIIIYNSLSSLPALINTHIAAKCDDNDLLKTTVK